MAKEFNDWLTHDQVENLMYSRALKAGVNVLNAVTGEPLNPANAKNPPVVILSPTSIDRLQDHILQFERNANEKFLREGKLCDVYIAINPVNGASSKTTESGIHWFSAKIDSRSNTSFEIDFTDSTNTDYSEAIHNAFNNIVLVNNKSKGRRQPPGTASCGYFAANDAVHLMDNTRPLTKESDLPNLKKELIDLGLAPSERTNGQPRNSGNNTPTTSTATNTGSTTPPPSATPGKNPSPATNNGTASPSNNKPTTPKPAAQGTEESKEKEIIPQKDEMAKKVKDLNDAILKRKKDKIDAGFGVGYTMLDKSGKILAETLDGFKGSALDFIAAIFKGLIRLASLPFDILGNGTKTKPGFTKSIQTDKANVAKIKGLQNDIRQLDKKLKSAESKQETSTTTTTSQETNIPKNVQNDARALKPATTGLTNGSAPTTSQNNPATKLGPTEKPSFGEQVLKNKDNKTGRSAPAA